MTNNDAYWNTQNYIAAQNKNIQAWSDHADQLKRDINTLKNRVRERDKLIASLEKSVKNYEANLNEAATKLAAKDYVIAELQNEVEGYKISQEIDQEVKGELRVELSMYVESAKRVSFVRLLDHLILENKDAARSVLAGN